MINKFRIENFLSFGKAQEFNLKPLTVVVGANNSGKSNLIQAFQFLGAFSDKLDINQAASLIGRDLQSLFHQNSNLRSQDSIVSNFFGLQIKTKIFEFDLNVSYSIFKLKYTIFGANPEINNVMEYTQNRHQITSGKLDRTRISKLFQGIRHSI